MLELYRQLRELLCVKPRFVFGQRATQLAQVQPEQIKRDHLSRKRFRRGNADLRSCVSENRSIGFTNDHRTLNVTDCEHLRAELFCFAQRCNRVSRFSRLRDDEQKGVVVHHRIAIAKLGRVIDVYRNPRELLDHVFAGESGMPRRTTRSNLDRREAFEVCFGDVGHLVEKDASGVE